MIGLASPAVSFRALAQQAITQNAHQPSLGFTRYQSAPQSMSIRKCPNVALVDSAQYLTSIHASLGVAAPLVLLEVVPIGHDVYNSQQLMLCGPLCLGRTAHARRHGMGQLQLKSGVKYCRMDHECMPRCANLWDAGDFTML